MSSSALPLPLPLLRVLRPLSVVCSGLATPLGALPPVDIRAVGRFEGDGVSGGFSEALRFKGDGVEGVDEEEAVVEDDGLDNREEEDVLAKEGPDGEDVIACHIFFRRSSLSRFLAATDLLCSLVASTRAASCALEVRRSSSAIRSLSLS